MYLLVTLKKDVACVLVSHTKGVWPLCLLGTIESKSLCMSDPRVIALKPGHNKEGATCVFICLFKGSVASEQSNIKREALGQSQ